MATSVATSLGSMPVIGESPDAHPMYERGVGAIPGEWLGLNAGPERDLGLLASTAHHQARAGHRAPWRARPGTSLGCHALPSPPDTPPSTGPRAFQPRLC